MKIFHSVSSQLQIAVGRSLGFSLQKRPTVSSTCFVSALYRKSNSELRSRIKATLLPHARGTSVSLPSFVRVFSSAILICSSVHLSAASGSTFLAGMRSEEHTTGLQSHSFISDAVFCL